MEEEREEGAPDDPPKDGRTQKLKCNKYVISLIPSKTCIGNLQPMSYIWSINGFFFYMNCIFGISYDGKYTK